MKSDQTLAAGRGAGFDRGSRVELDRFNARMRHFQGVAASVMEEAALLWRDIMGDLEDPRSPEEIIDGVPFSDSGLPAGGWPEFKEKLYLLGHYLDYTRRLCDGSVLDESEETVTDKEVS